MKPKKTAQPVKDDKLEEFFHAEIKDIYWAEKILAGQKVEHYEI